MYHVTNVILQMSSNHSSGNFQDKQFDQSHLDKQSVHTCALYIVWMTTIHVTRE